MTIRPTLLLVGLAFLLLACSVSTLLSSSEPSTDTTAVETRVAAKIYATLTASAPAQPRSTSTTPRTSGQGNGDVLLRDHECVPTLGYLYCVAALENRSQANRNIWPYVYFRVFDNRGVLIKDTYEAATYFLPLETRKVFARFSLPKDAQFARYETEMKVLDGGSKSVDTSVMPLDVSEVVYQRGSDRVTFVLGNKSSKTLKSVSISAIVYGPDGRFAGGADEFAPVLLPNGKTRVEFSLNLFGQGDRVELYPYLSAIASVQ